MYHDQIDVIPTEYANIESKKNSPAAMSIPIYVDSKFVRKREIIVDAIAIQTKAVKIFVSFLQSPNPNDDNKM